jgi:hypothetical protein
MERNDALLPGKVVTKPLLFLLAFLFFGSAFVNTCKAQAALLVLIFGDKIATENFHTSIDCGLTLSQLPGLPDNKFRPGIYFGLGTFVKLNDTWALLPEFKPLSRQGGKNIKPFYTYANTNFAIESADLQMNYIDIPLLLQYKFKHLTFAAGPQISFLTKANQVSKGTNISTQTKVRISETCYKYTKGIMYCFPVEVGLRLPQIIPDKDFDFKIRYSIGLSNIIDDVTYGSSRASTFELFLSMPFVKKQTKVAN